jgi:hypothetical protein
MPVGAGDVSAVDYVIGSKVWVVLADVVNYRTVSVLGV